LPDKAESTEFKKLIGDFVLPICGMSYETLNRKNHGKHLRFSYKVRSVRYPRENWELCTF